jgi:Protein of unknown function (DUF1557).
MSLLMAKRSISTPGHPFYLPVKGWTDAARLRAGDILVLVNGEYVVVEKVQHELLESPINVYNLNVEGFHTYYVSSGGVLVHNRCGDTGTYNSLHRAEKGTGNEVHHIIEKRFLKLTNYSSKGRMQSVVLSPQEHALYTKLWRKTLPYGGNYSTDQVINAARKVYAGNKKLLDIALSAF